MDKNKDCVLYVSKIIRVSKKPLMENEVEDGCFYYEKEMKWDEILEDNRIGDKLEKFEGCQMKYFRG